MLNRFLIEIVEFDVTISNEHDQIRVELAYVSNIWAYVLAYAGIYHAYFTR